MSTESNPLILNTNEEYYFDLKIEINNYQDIQIIKQYDFNLTEFYGFAVSKSLFIKSIYTINTLMNLISQKKFNILQKLTIIAKCKFNSIKQIKHKFSFIIVSKVKLISFKKIQLQNKFNIHIGKYTLLKKIDDMSLDALDNLTIGEVDKKFGDGINLQVAKQLQSNEHFSVNAILNLSLMRIMRLKDYDNSTIGSMDNVTLQDLDRIFLT